MYMSAPPPVVPPPVRPPARGSAFAIVWVASWCLACAVIFLWAVNRLVGAGEAPPPTEGQEQPALEEHETSASNVYVPSNPLAADPERGVAAHPKSSEALYDIGPQPEVSAWDGIVPQAAAWFEQNLHDYGSSRVVAASRPVATPAGWVQVVRIRSKNAFGAYVVNTLVFYVKHGELVDVAFY